MSVTDPSAELPDPPVPVVSEASQDDRLVRQMLAMTPQQRLATLVRWVRLVTPTAARDAAER